MVAQKQYGLTQAQLTTEVTFDDCTAAAAAELDPVATFEVVPGLDSFGGAKDLLKDKNW